MTENPFRKVRFDWTINLGAVLQLGGVVGVGLGLFAYGLKFQYATETGLAEGAAARLKYIPIIESLQKSDEVQTFRQEATSKAIDDLRQLSLDNSQKLYDIGTDVAVIKSKLEDEDKKK